MALQCKKFEANIFNKTKCQICFKDKGLHSAEALENSKASRKISKCGYLFVAPESFDFASPLDRTRRWQRRFFVLYDDGELTYSVDENVNTVPQGVIDMNHCSDVYDAQDTTSHQDSIAVKTPKQTTYIKGATKEETSRWNDVLVMYPRSTKTKHRRTATFHATTTDSSRATGHSTKTPVIGASGPTSYDGLSGLAAASGGVTTYKRRHRASEPAINYSPVKQPRSSIQPITTEEWIRQRRASLQERTGHLARQRHRSRESDSEQQNHAFNFSFDSSSTIREDSQVGGELDRTVGGEGEVFPVVGDKRAESSFATFRGVRSLKHKNDRTHNEGLRKSNSMQDLTSTSSEDEQFFGAPHQPLYRSRSRENLYTFPHSQSESAPASVSPKTNARSPSATVNGASSVSRSKAAGGAVSRGASLTSSTAWGKGATRNFAAGHGTAPFLYNGRNKNETDEHKSKHDVEMAKSGELAARLHHQLSMPTQQDKYNDLMYMKKGWLLKQDEQSREWKKCWFVLSGASLKYFQDSRAEEANAAEGYIDISACYDISDLDVNRNYGFQLKTSAGGHVLSAMTSGIRTNWIQAIQKCMEMNSQAGASSAPPTKPTRSSSLSSASSSRHSSITGDATAKGTDSAATSFEFGIVYTANPAASQHSAAAPSRSRNSSTNSHSDTELRADSLSNSQANSVDGSQRRDSGSLTCTWPYKSRDSTSQDSSAESGLDQSRSVSESSSVSTLIPSARDVTSSGASSPSRQPKPKGTPASYVSKLVAEQHPSTRRTRAISPVDTPTKAIIAQSSRRKASDGKSPRAPSAKVKDRSRAKSPRTKSPPPSLSLAEKPSDKAKSPSKAHSLSEKDAVVDLLETQVDSLKGQLDEAHTHITNLQQDNSNLKLQIRTTKMEHQDSVTDLEGDQQRFLTQIEDMQVDMEHAAGILANKLEEHEEQAEIARVQVAALTATVDESQNTIRMQQRNIEDLQAKLAESMAELVAAERSLEDAHRTLSADHASAEQNLDELKSMVQRLEHQVHILEQDLDHAHDELDHKDSNIAQLKEQIHEKTEEVEAMTLEVEEAATLRQEVRDKTQQLKDLTLEMTSLHDQLCAKEEEISHLNEQLTTNHTQDKAVRNRDDLVRHSEEIEKQLDAMQKQTKMADTLNSDMANILREKDETIAQLEERLMENDARVEELNDELKKKKVPTATLR